MIDADFLGVTRKIELFSTALVSAARHDYLCQRRRLCRRFVCTDIVVDTRLVSRLAPAGILLLAIYCNSSSN
jgi:hypothetical protein